MARWNAPSPSKRRQQIDRRHRKRMLRKATINDGKIDGDNVSFSINANFQGNEMKLQYKGKVTADQIKLNVDFGGCGRLSNIR
jgi:hypothetical protein